LVTGK